MTMHDMCVCEDIPDNFESVRYRPDGDFVAMGYQFAIREHAQPSAPGVTTDAWVASLDAVIEDASWSGSEAVLAAVHLWLATWYPGVIAEIPRPERLDFTDGLLDFCQKAQVFYART